MMKRVIVFGVVVILVLMVSSEAMAASKIAYVCSIDGLNQVCLSDPDGANSFVLTDFAASYDWMHIDSSPDGSELIVMGFGDHTSLARIPVDGSAISEITPSNAPQYANYGDIAWFELPSSVASLSPFNQTITVFLLGMIASALIMRGRTVKEAS